MSGYRFRALLPGSSAKAFERAGRSTWWQVTGGDLPAPVLVRLGPTPEGEIACTGVVVGIDDEGKQRAVTASALRIPLAGIVSELTQGIRRDYKLERGERSVSFKVEHFEQILGFLADSAPPITVPRVRPGVRGHSDEHFREVVTRYRRALKDEPFAPTKAVIAQYPNWSPAAVRYWLRIARKRGLLAKSEPGRPGEAGKGKGRDGKTRKR